LLALKGGNFGLPSVSVKEEKKGINLVEIIYVTTSGVMHSY